ncbi:3592_t:CDS:2 [Entrophospora sp. SA101]|nr:3592_t:CDS:2 [Entrophospora sp. SA101]CAJ0838841.1 7648_t:CDS:2 [Entrophospora sp. SA101]CAJ0925295.1 3284_t:CDS:2 [Entrophospora sp. SA101]
MEINWNNTCDVHTHVHDDIENLERIGELKTDKLCLMGTNIKDLDLVAELSIKYKDKDFILENKDDNSSSLYDEFIKELPNPIAFNIWYDKLESLIIKYNENCLIGEVGIDRSFKLKNPNNNKKLSNYQISIDHQILILEKQIELAIRYGKSISLHCVQSSGKIVEILKKLQQKNTQQIDSINNDLQLKICFHSFCGSIDTIKLLLSLNNSPKKNKKSKLLSIECYFSFSKVINERLSNRLHDLIKFVPEDRLLVESDFHSPVGLDYLMQDIIQLISKVKDWSCDFTINKLKDNFLNFINNYNNKDKECNVK